MRSIWKGAITFGLVNVPVKVYSATEDHDIGLHQVHDKDGGRIRYQRRCEICGKIVDYDHINKAYDDGEKTVILTDEDLKSLPEERSREIDVVEFVPSDQLDPIMFDRSYFLEPDSKSSKAYVLLRRTLEETERTAIVHFALRQKTRLGALRVRGDVLMLQSLLWDDEVREASFPALEERVRISEKELEMSESLVDSFAADFSPEKFSDDYQEQLRTLIDAKLEHGDAVDTEATFGEQPEESEGGGEVLDLMEALRRSVERNRGGGAKKTRAASGTRKSAADEDDDDEEDEPKKPAAKRTASGKSTTKKAAASKKSA
jgi:DNA end-binding protein Ku